MIVTLSLKDNKIFSLPSTILLAITLMTSSCQRDTKVDLLSNSNWEYLGETNNCKVYYSFDKSTFISINPCNGIEGIISKVAWETGNYQISPSKIKLTIENSCEELKIGQSTNFDYTVKPDLLVLTSGNESYHFQPVSTLPIIPDDVENGYWYFDQYGYPYWRKIDSCSFDQKHP